MIHKVKFANEAATEFRKSVRWYKSNSPGLGEKFAAEIDSTIERIKLNPDFYPIIVEEI
jgi:hypothetical protein